MSEDQQGVLETNAGRDERPHVRSWRRRLWQPLLVLTFLAGTALAGGTAIALAEDSAPGRPAGQRAEQAASVEVPDFSGMDFDQAIARGAALGLRMAPEPRWLPFPGIKGRVVGQEPAAGTSVDPANGYIQLTALTGFRSIGKPRVEFRTTGGAAYCQGSSEDEYELTTFVCWVPRSGRMVTIDVEGHVKMRFHRQAIGARPTGFRTIKIGGKWLSPTQSSNLPQIECYSKPKALRCDEGGGFAFAIWRNGAFRKRTF